MRSLVLIATAGLCSSLLVGCAIPEKYQEKEKLEATDTYSLFTVLAPYEMED